MRRGRNYVATVELPQARPRPCFNFHGHVAVRRLTHHRDDMQKNVPEATLSRWVLYYEPVRVLAPPVSQVLHGEYHRRARTTFQRPLLLVLMHLNFNSQLPREIRDPWHRVRCIPLRVTPSSAESVPVGQVGLGPFLDCGTQNEPPLSRRPPWRARRRDL